MIRKMLVVTLALTLFVLTGCQTVEGLGKDVQDASRATKDAMTD